MHFHWFIHTWEIFKDLDHMQENMTIYDSNMWITPQPKETESNVTYIM